MRNEKRKTFEMQKWKLEAIFLTLTGQVRRRRRQSTDSCANKEKSEYKERLRDEINEDGLLSSHGKSSLHKVKVVSDT
jgi:hypothetical protein